MEEFEKFYNKTLRFLSYRPRSEFEVREYLKKPRGRFASKKKPPPDELIELIIKKLKEQKFLDDRDFTRWYVEQRTRVKPRAKRVIQFELKRKGIGKDELEDFSVEFPEDLEMAKILAERKLGRLKGLEFHEKKRKLFEFLARKGFDYDTSREAIDEIYKKEV